MSEMADGYRLLAQLRVLERQLGLLRSEWRAFGDNPSPESLADVCRRAQRFSDSLEVLVHTVDRDVQSDSSNERDRRRPVRRDRPAPRAVVSASRDLDAKIGEATRRWKEVLDGDEAGDLDRLVSVLQASADRVAILVAALGGTPPPRRQARVDNIGTNIGTGDPGTMIEAAAAEVEGMLWRLQADWQQLRRAPSVDRLGLLMDSFEAAAEGTARLREMRGRVGQARFQSALRVGRQLTDGVRFLPYRDPFTGIYNREGFDALAEAELKRCRRYRRSFGILFLEISSPDLAGLRRVAATARAELRDYDLIARYVDDLILIGVPEGGGGATRRVASRILRALRAGDMGGWFQRLAYATMPEDGSTLSGLIDTARDRLQP